MTFNLFGSFTNTIEELDEKIMACDKCPYSSLTQNLGKRVNGSGSMESGLVVIGQNPGKTEMETGIPFSGSSGNMLKSIMKRAGINTRKVYFTNIIRCAPPQGKNLITKSIDMCSSWLEDEIGILKPSFIVCLGNVAGKEVLGTCEVSKDSGKVMMSRFNVNGMLTYHTAYLLRVKSTDDEEYNKLLEEVEVHWRTVNKIVTAMNRQ